MHMTSIQIVLIFYHVFEFIITGENVLYNGCFSSMAANASPVNEILLLVSESDFAPTFILKGIFVK